MDTEQALITAIWYRLRGDEELQSLMGGEVKLRLMWAKKDDEFPYAVHRIESSDLEPWVMRDGTYYLDLWDYHQTAERISAMRSRSVRILDKSYIGLLDPSSTFMSVSQPAVGEPIPIIIAARLNLTTSAMVPEETENIYHYALRFNMRHSRSIQEIEHLIGV